MELSPYSPTATLAFFDPRFIKQDIDYMRHALNQGRPVYIASTDLARFVARYLKSQGELIGQDGVMIRESVSPIDGKPHGLHRITMSNP